VTAARRAFRIAYDGTPFHGFQRQPDLPTVEGALFDALRDLGVLDGDESKPPGYAAAGRTDAGASAVAQTVAFDCPAWLSPRALNAELPDAAWAWARADVPADFHATHDARFREYVYVLHATAADPDRAREAARALSGEHDFHNLTRDADGTVRDLSLDAVPDGPFLVLTARADGFPRGLVRRLASLVRGVATGETPLDRVDRVLDSAPLDGPRGIPPAPPGPLLLADVGYEGVAFERDERAVAAARAHFAAERSRHRALARVSRTLADGV